MYCDRDGLFQRASCQRSTCPAYAEPTMLYCVGENGEPLEIDLVHDDPDAPEECEDDAGRWVADGEAACICIENYFPTENKF